MHVCSYCSGTCRKLVLTSEYEIEKGQPDADPKFIVLAKDVDKTDRFIIAARRRAEAALHETSPKLTALEKAMWLKLKRGERPCKNNKAS